MEIYEMVKSVGSKLNEAIPIISTVISAVVGLEEEIYCEEKG